VLEDEDKSDDVHRVSWSDSDTYGTPLKALHSATSVKLDHATMDVHTCATVHRWCGEMGREPRGSLDTELHVFILWVGKSVMRTRKSAIPAVAPAPRQS
jgi:hypothetical protein